MAIVRAALPTDIPAVQSVARASWHDTYKPWLSREAIDAFLERAYAEPRLWADLRGGGLLVLEEEGAVLGYLRLGERDGMHWLGAIYLHPEAQGRGLGRLMWEAALEWFKARGARELRLEVVAGNTRARGFYEHLGFRPLQTKRFAVAGESLEELVYGFTLEP